jgi:hypothetical protein
MSCCDDDQIPDITVTISGIDLDCKEGAKVALASNIRFELDGVEYLWGGGLGATVISLENHCKVGELRMIGGRMLKAFMITRHLYRKDRVCWCSADNANSYDWVRNFKTELFS